MTRHYTFVDESVTSATMLQHLRVSARDDAWELLPRAASPD